MSTLSSPAPGCEGADQVHPFPYREAFSSGSDVAADYRMLYPGSPSGEEEIRRREEEARCAGRSEGEAEARAALEAAVTRSCASVAEALADFAQERKKFYEHVEPEVVNLALSIARKILHREAQIDPLLLAGMVRVALEKIEFSTQVTVRVNPGAAEAWREYFNRLLDPRDVPELAGDPTLDRNRCVLETHLGKTELGWEVQLKEIELGLLDLLAQRPQAGA